jgi:FkbM family methyltransferase
VFLSYAQNLEDYHLSLVFRGQERGFYVDAGAGHPVADNVSLWFYNRGWSGLIIEPQHQLASLYPSVRPRDRVYQGLVGDRDGTAEFFVVDRLHGLSTSVRAHAEEALKFAAGYVASDAPVTTLAALLAPHAGRSIDFLKIDVEGAERAVLTGNDWNRHRPRIVVVEAIRPGTGEPAWEDWEDVLIDNHYSFALFDSLNRFYVANECRELAERLPREPVAFDTVLHMYEVGRALESASHPDHRLAQDLAKGFMAILPRLDPQLVADILATSDSVLAQSLTPDELRLSLGRIASGYDGGQLF